LPEQYRRIGIQPSRNGLRYQHHANQGSDPSLRDPCGTPLWELFKPAKAKNVAKQTRRMKYESAASPSFGKTGHHELHLAAKP
jgi:hypothetical protein